MKRYLKPILLTATLLIPIAIFLFLRQFGENRFDIPVYYVQGVETSFDGCDFVHGKQHRIDPVEGTEGAICIYMFRSENPDPVKMDNVKQQILEAVPVHMITYAQQEEQGVRYLTSPDFTSIMHCVFVTDTLDQFILVDSDRKIRGYYNTDREDIDRLIVETKILMENESDSK